jgi:hypothetical protein
MAATALGMSKRTLVQALGGSAALFGVAGLLAPRALGATYGVPALAAHHTTAPPVRKPDARPLAWSFTARTKEETDRMLTVAARG